MTFWWWDDAVAWAHELARETKMRHCVVRDRERACWRVDLVEWELRLLTLEVCS